MICVVCSIEVSSSLVLRLRYGFLCHLLHQDSVSLYGLLPAGSTLPSSPANFVPILFLPMDLETFVPLSLPLYTHSDLQDISSLLFFSCFVVSGSQSLEGYILSLMCSPLLLLRFCFLPLCSVPHHLLFPWLLWLVATVTVSTLVTLLSYLSLCIKVPVLQLLLVIVKCMFRWFSPALSFCVYYSFEYVFQI